MTSDNGGRGREEPGADNRLDKGSGAKERHGCFLKNGEERVRLAKRVKRRESHHCHHFEGSL